ncbi:hypothetical protein Tco_0777594 [Tanacetum coccineum]
MPYLQFTKVIINHFISKDKTISMRNRINLHTICDDSLLDTLKFVSKTQDYQQKLSPVKEAEPVKKAKRVKRLPKKSTTATTASVVIRDTPGVSVSKKKAPAKADISKVAQVMELVPNQRFQMSPKTRQLVQMKELILNHGESKDDDGNSDADDNERTDSDDDDENPSFTLKDYDEEEHDEEYESDNDYENVYEEEDDDLYKAIA